MLERDPVPVPVPVRVPVRSGELLLAAREQERVSEWAQERASKPEEAPEPERLLSTAPQAEPPAPAPAARP